MAKNLRIILLILSVVVIPLEIQAQKSDQNVNYSDQSYENQDSSTVTYIVEKDGSILEIASKYKVTVKELKEINNLQSNEIVAGQKLLIPVTTNENQDKTILSSEELKDKQLQVLDDSKQYSQKTPTEIEEAEEKTVEPEVEKVESDTQNPVQKVVEETSQKDQTEQAIGDTDVEEIVNLQTEMELKDLIQTISEITSEAFILDDSVKGKKVTIIAPQGGFKKQNALRLFETILDLNGFSIVKKDGVNKIVQKKDIKTESIPTEIGPITTESSDRFITKLIQLENVRASELSVTLKPLVSRDGDLVVYPASNILILIDSVDNVNRIMQIIDSLDVEKMIEFIKIEYADAGEIAQKLLEIFGTGGRAVSPRQRQTTTRRQSGRQQRERTTEQQPTVTGESDILGFKVITEPRTNSLILIAYPQDMTKLKKIIKILDVETDQPEQGIYVIRIKHADAEQIVSVLSTLLGDRVGFAGGTVGTGRRVGGSPRVQTGTTGLGNVGLGSVGSGFSSGLGGTSRQPIQRGVSGAGVGFGRGATVGAAAVVQSGDLRITADPATNSIIIVGNRRQYESLKVVIDELDIRRKQVFVEAAILEVGLDRLQAFGTNFSFGFTVNDNNLVFGGQQLPGVPSLLGSAADPEATINLAGSLSGFFLGIIGEEVDPDGSGPIPPIPSFTAIFQALTSVTDVNVLSTPSIVTTDNEQAEIVVADVIPFPTGSTVGQSGITVSTIERLPVGIRLAITPQISEGDYLNLNLITEVSATRDAPADLNTAEFGIATTTRSADSSVIVKDGQTIVIGGLVQDRESILQNKTPILGDIPYIGNLFKFKRKQRQKLNLLILLTPRIVTTEEDMQMILEEQQRRKMLLQEKGLESLQDSTY